VGSWKVGGEQLDVPSLRREKKQKPFEKEKGNLTKVQRQLCATQKTARPTKQGHSARKGRLHLTARKGEVAETGPQKNVVYSATRKGGVGVTRHRRKGFSLCGAQTFGEKLREEKTENTAWGEDVNS